MLIRYEGDLRAWQKSGDPDIKMQTPFMTAYLQGFIQPITGEVYPFSQGDIGNCLAVVPMTHDKRLVFTNQWKQAVGMLCPQFPGGRLTENKSLDVVAAKILLTETGYMAQNIHVLPWRFHFYDTILSSYYFVALATGCTHLDRPQEPSTELIRVMELTVQELLDMILEGKVHEPAAYVGIIFAMLLGYLPPLGPNDLLPSRDPL